jgi:hypothetical protein
VINREAEIIGVSDHFGDRTADADRICAHRKTTFSCGDVTLGRS